MQTVQHIRHGADLALESCPEAVQVMPPESSGRRLPLAFTVIIDTLLVALLLGGLMTLPAWINSLIS